MTRSLLHITLLCAGLLLAGCTGMKNISPSDPLLVGNTIAYADHHPFRKTLDPLIKSAIKPEPNGKLFWMRPALARYNMLSDSAKTKKFWRKKVAPPVLLSQADANKVAASMEDKLFHQGYFHNGVDVDTLRSGKRKVKLNYTITLHQPYTIADVTYPDPINDLTQKINEAGKESKLYSGDIYTLDAVKQERIHIDRALKEAGYIYFSPDFLLMRADTLSGDHEVRIHVTLKPETPPESRVAYTIRKVFIHDDNTPSTAVTDTIQLDSIYLISATGALKFSVLDQGIFLRPGQHYAISDYMHTVRALGSLPLIRNVNIKFLPVEGSDQLDVIIFLAQRKRFAYTAEFNTLFRSTNYFGPGVIFSYEDRNANKGAELLKLNLRGSFEMQIVDGEINPAYQLGVGIDYTLPRFFPGFLLPSARKSLPTTTISGGYNLFNRLDLYRLNSFQTNLRYSWSKTDRIGHSFHPIEVTYTRLPEDSKSEEFNDYLEENPGVRRSFDEQFILGMGYEFAYQSAPGKSSDFFFRGGLDVAGNLLDVLFSASNATTDSLGRYSLFGVPFSQYLRPRIDVRHGIKFNPRSGIVTRFSAGVGIPLGNSSILPYIKQFYVGGTNSLRSFIARSVGPGSEVPPQGYNDVTGDIRLEGNIEYRFEVAGSLKGALFVDAGNVWLFNEDPTRPNGDFHVSTFLNEIAMSTGWGLRWDFDFLVARLDFAYTLRTPYLEEGERWTNGIKFWDPAVSFAIGYPF